jgi:UPF0176 protein
MYQVIAYYKYCQIDEADKFREDHHIFCLKKNLRGRIYISDEGINGTISGLEIDCKDYMDHLRSDLRFSDVDFKIHAHDEHAFAKLHVRLKNEIVNFGDRSIKPHLEKKNYVEVENFLNEIDENTVLLDARSNYEHKLGKFKDAITLDIENFREFKEKVKDIKHKFLGKKVITYCTGNIKCEKASIYLSSIGVENVFQLKGGIIEYGIKTNGKNFEGKCYVFDNRISVDINKYNPVDIGNCIFCKKKSSKMVNCANPVCNIQEIICEDCLLEKKGACSNSCRENPKKRQFNEKGQFYKKTNGYNPEKGLKRKYEL